jgi:hypothetical protein
MKKCLLLLIACGLVLSFSTPSHATFFKNDRNTKIDLSDFWDKLNDWPEYDWPKNDWPEYEWPKNDWPKGHECNRWCGCKENPVPEPATAGLAFMGLGALAFATRRRK